MAKFWQMTELAGANKTLREHIPCACQNVHLKYYGEKCGAGVEFRDKLVAKWCIF